MWQKGRQVAHNFEERRHAACANPMARNVNPLPHASMRWTELRTHAHVHSELPLFDPIAAARLVRWRALEDLKAKAQKVRASAASTSPDAQKA